MFCGRSSMARFRRWGLPPPPPTPQTAGETSEGPQSGAFLLPDAHTLDLWQRNQATPSALLAALPRPPTQWPSIRLNIRDRWVAWVRELLDMPAHLYASLLQSQNISTLGATETLRRAAIYLGSYSPFLDSPWIVGHLRDIGMITDRQARWVRDSNATLLHVHTGEDGTQFATFPPELRHQIQLYVACRIIEGPLVAQDIESNQRQWANEGARIGTTWSAGGVVLGSIPPPKEEPPAPQSRLRRYWIKRR